MRAISLSLAALLSTTAAMPALAAPETEIVADANAPKGKLPDAATPSAYRLDFTILPEADRFSGHDEIDLKFQSSVPSRSTSTAATSTCDQGRRRWSGGKVDPRRPGPRSTTPAPRGSISRPMSSRPARRRSRSIIGAAFNDSASGLFHVKVDDKWYSWTQFESIDARAAYPGFDEPGFKTPFTVSVTTTPGWRRRQRAESGVTKTADAWKSTSRRDQAAADLSRRAHHRAVRPQDRDDRARRRAPAPMPYGVVATQAQKASWIM